MRSLLQVKLLHSSILLNILLFKMVNKDKYQCVDLEKQYCWVEEQVSFRVSSKVLCNQGLSKKGLFHH